MSSFNLRHFISFFMLLCTKVYAQKDLEEFKTDFVLENKRIQIQDASHAFNPSIVKWRDHYLMCFRRIENSYSYSQFSSAEISFLELVWLDEEFNVISKPYSLTLDHPEKKRPFILAEDGRLLVDGERLYLVYSGNKEQEITDAGFRMYVAELEFDGDFHVLSNECLTNFEGENADKREKNWVPFIHEGQLLLAYSLSPHKIFKPLLNGSQSCQTIASTLPSVVWEWGELRGGTPALKINDQFYLSFFHSSLPLSTIHSNNQPILHYFMGVVLFSAKPPFEIKFVSPEPIIGQNFYQGEVYTPYWHPVRVVFPCGLMIDKHHLWVSYGRQDHEIWIAKIDKEKLLESLIHVSTIPNFESQLH